MDNRTLFICLLASLLLSGAGHIYGQSTTDNELYRQQQAAARKQAQRERQAERAQAAKAADINSEVAQETADYLAEVARIQKHNNQVADYMTRDIAHRLDIWAFGGLITTPTAAYYSGAGGIGVGYQMRYNKFLLTTGLEYMPLAVAAVPVQMGMELQDWYWQLGAKAGWAMIPVGGSFPMRIGPTAEIGMNFDRWSRPSVAPGQQLTDKQRTQMRWHYKLALYAEYGVSNLSAKPDEDIIAGIKFSAAYQFRRKQKTMEPLPTRPRPAMQLMVKDAQGRPVEGAVIQSTDRVANSKSYATTLPDGKATMRLARGEYDLRAYHKGKMAEQLSIRHTDLNGDQYELILNQDDNTPPEVKIVDEEEIIIDPNSPCLVGRVIDNETGKPLDAGVRFGNWIDTTALYHGTANAKGVYVTRLHRGDYSIHARKAGYMPLIDVIHFDNDSVILKLKPIRVGNSAKVKDLFFVKGKAALLPESETALANLAMFLRQNPDVCIRITAHTDNQGDADRLLRLSRSRARAIRRNLVNRGIDINRIDIDGKGDTQPVADNNSNYGRDLNQRIVMEITSVTGAPKAAEE